MTTRYLDAAKWKWRGLMCAVQLRGTKEQNLWMQQRPKKFVQQAEDICKLKTSILDNNPAEFPGLRHESGCSMQYIIMLANILGGDDWYRQYINPYQEAPVENQEFDIASLLQKARKKVGK